YVGGDNNSGNGPAYHSGGYYNGTPPQNPFPAPANEPTLPQDTPAMLTVKDLAAGIDGSYQYSVQNQTDPYSFVKSAGDNGYSVGRFAFSAPAILDWISDLSDDELDELDEEDDDGTDDDTSDGDDSSTSTQQGQNNTPGNGGTNSKGGTGTNTRGGNATGKTGGTTGKTGTNTITTTPATSGGSHPHLYHHGTSHHLRQIRDALRKFKQAHPNEQGAQLDSDFLAQEMDPNNKDGLNGLAMIKLLGLMSDKQTTPDALSAALKDPANDFDAALQERMMDDLLDPSNPNSYAAMYVKYMHDQGKDVDLNNPSDLKQASAVLILATELGHYPTQAEFDDQYGQGSDGTAGGVVDQVLANFDTVMNATIARPEPSTDGSMLGNDLFSFRSDQKQGVAGFPFENVVNDPLTDSHASFIQARILAAAYNEQGQQL
ncbi:MAG: hypothetical protein ACRD3W_00765, partial [Terriglobales bacterium]